MPGESRTISESRCESLLKVKSKRQAYHDTFPAGGAMWNGVYHGFTEGAFGAGGYRFGGGTGQLMVFPANITVPEDVIRAMADAV